MSSEALSGSGESRAAHTRPEPFRLHLQRQCRLRRDTSIRIGDPYAMNPDLSIDNFAIYPEARAGLRCADPPSECGGTHERADADPGAERGRAARYRLCIHRGTALAPGRVLLLRRCA